MIIKSKPKKLKKCAVRTCRTEFVPYLPLQKVCSPQCAKLLAEDKRLKKEARDKQKQARERREGLERIKGVSELKKEAQDAFNAVIRFRDRNEPCISCGRFVVEMTHGGQWDCGHYLSVGSHPELRFEYLNAYKQCKSCNGGSGKYERKRHLVSIEYRKRLIDKIGEEKVLWLEDNHEPKRYRTNDLRILRDQFKNELKQMKKNAESD